MKKRFTNLVPEMIGRLAMLLLLCCAPAARTQPVPACPFPGNEADPYENPLLEKWLSAYDVKYYDLQLLVSDTTTYLEGTARILLEFLRKTDTVVLELQDALEVSEVRSEGYEPASAPALLDDFVHTDNALYISLEESGEQGELLFIDVDYAGLAGQNKGFFAGISNATDPTYGFKVTYTLSEPQNARDWFPSKQVLTDQIDSASVRLRCADHLMAASNGILRNIETLEVSTHTFHWHTGYPIAYYLLSFTVADYRDFSFYVPSDGGDDSILVQNYVYDSDEVISDWEDDILATGDLISLYSRLLREYPFAGEKYGHAMAPMGGGMEHQTMTTLQNFNFFLVAHELAHQWFGDYVTCKSWQDIWVNEGFASYMEFVAAENLQGGAIARAWMDNAMSVAIGETEGSVFVPEEGVENSFRLFDLGLSYKKGAILLHMIRYRLGDDALFFSILGKYLEDFGDSLAGGLEFMQVLESESGMDFSCFFRQWYFGEGFPRFNLHWSQKSDSLQIISEETTSAPGETAFFETPFDLEMLLGDGSTKRVRLFQDEALKAFSIPVSGTVTQVRFDPDQWLLKTVNVVHQIPDNKAFVYGPNPVKDELVVQFNNIHTIDQVVITSLNGQEVLRFNNSTNPVTMDLSLLSDGPYLLVMKEADRSYVERIVKISGE